MTRKEMIDLCYESTAFLDVLEDADAAWAADAVIDDLIDELRSIPGIPERSHYEWFVVLGDLRRGIEEDLADLMNNRVDLRDAIRAIVDGIEDEAGGGAR